MPRLVRINGKLEDCSKYGYPESWHDVDQGKPSQAALNRAVAIIVDGIRRDLMARMEAEEQMDSGLRRNDEAAGMDSGQVPCRNDEVREVPA